MTFTYPSHTTKGCVPLSSDVSENTVYCFIMIFIYVCVEKLMNNKKIEESKKYVR